MSEVIPAGEFGAKVRARLEEQPVVWFSTVNRRGIPQPNPVWFHWSGGNRIVTYNLPDSARVRNAEQRPAVSLHFDQLDGASDIVVLTGTARVGGEEPDAASNAGYVAKYAQLMPTIGHDPASFAARYSTPIVIEVERVRGG